MSNITFYFEIVIGEWGIELFKLDVRGINCRSVKGGGNRWTMKIPIDDRPVGNSIFEGEEVRRSRQRSYEKFVPSRITDVSSSGREHRGTTDALGLCIV